MKPREKDLHSALDIDPTIKRVIGNRWCHYVTAYPDISAIYLWILATHGVFDRHVSEPGSDDKTHLFSYYSITMKTP